jgi:hypothetical protein
MSGLEFDCDHFPGTFYSKELNHPIFYIPQKRLLSYTGKWAAGELTKTDAYLLFLAILNSSEQVTFRVPVFRTPMTDSIVASNMEYLIRTVIKLNTIRTPGSHFPSFVISPDTKNLANVRYWIELWDKSYKDFQDGYRSAHDSSKLIKREAALQRMIKNPHKKLREYAYQIADWAIIAGDFPKFEIINPFSSKKTKIALAEYWKEIIIRCTRDEQLFSIPDNDLEELLNHCNDNIPIGSIYSNALFKALRHGLAKKKNFLGLGDYDLKSKFAFIDDPKDVETANMRALIDSAPTELPRPEQYPTHFAYMKAKMRWDMSKKFGPSTESDGE